MTLPEIAMALDDDLEKVRPPHGARPMSRLELTAHITWLRSLTPRQRLELARDGEVTTR